jgi:hypothetical protein
MGESVRPPAKQAERQAGGQVDHAGKNKEEEEKDERNVLLRSKWLWL